MKKIINLVLAIVIAFSCFVASGCGGKVNSSDPQALELFIYSAGYGHTWLEKILEEFKEEEWVKEKYPELTTSLKVSELEAEASTLLQDETGKANPYEIIFGQVLNKYMGKNGKVEDLTEKVYNTLVPGESVYYKDKMLQSARKSNIDPSVEQGQDPIYYTASYASGMTGMIYNADRLSAMGFSVPNTTDELVNIMKTIKERNSSANKLSGYTKTYSMVTYTVSTYVNYLFYTWWAQYQGSEEFANFFKGYDSEMNSYGPTVLAQQGRLKSLEVVEQIMSKDNGYTLIEEDTSRFAYRAAQGKIITGNAVFMANGDWFDNEMRGTVLNEETVKLMRTPIVSKIIEKTPSIANDAELSALITAIDAGVTAIDGNGYSVTQEDYDTILKARVCVYTIGPGHNAVVPKIAAGKEVAYDFLRYLATDKANEIYIRETKGASLPFEYDVTVKNPELLNSLTPMQKGRLEYFNGYNIEIDLLPAPNSFPLVLYGGFGAMSAYGNPGAVFLEGFDKGSYVSGAQKLFMDDYKYWTEDEQTRFKSALNAAGLQ